MRFKRGSKVEVLKEANTLTAWCGAEIISGKGQSYTVRYDHYVPEHGEVSERVHRNLVRPRPPVQKVESWVAGDAVEVFDDVMWRVAIISRVRGSYCLVRLLESSYKFGVHISNIRVRQCWQNDEWVLMFKGSGISGELEFSQLSTSDCYKEMSLQEAQTRAAVKNQEKCDLSAARYIRANSGNVKKFRAAEKEDRGHPGLPVNVDQVDAVAYPRKNMGEKYMRASFNNITNGYNELDRRELNDFVGCSVARDSDSNDSDSNMSSVGSCSAISRTLNKFSTQMLAVSYQEANSLTSDAESCCGGSRDKEICDLHPEESIAESMHSLELHTYRRTLEELYASGPLSWEKEGLLTNLRITLHISNDEHLMELKNLISGGKKIWRLAKSCFQWSFTMMLAQSVSTCTLLNPEADRVRPSSKMSLPLKCPYLNYVLTCSHRKIRIWEFLFRRHMWEMLRNLGG
ncbi:ENT domain-containing protein [Heracleum sosnowskyi]|uniref:ENT domain-containing protein n=1 Tax=Heracleum sosnowskyi TaxID=360622 RepID=A0AAD8N3N4_9APIA|nr:ENT domain-containing protein [Heracleum sosnowskyi]